MTAEDFWRKYRGGIPFLIGYVENPGIEDMVYIKEYCIPLNTLTIFSNGVKNEIPDIIEIIGTDPVITISVNDIAWHKPTDLNK